MGPRKELGCGHGPGAYREPLTGGWLHGVEAGQAIGTRRHGCHYQGICPRMGLRLRTLSRILRMKQDLQQGTVRSVVLKAKRYQEGKGECIGGKTCLLRWAWELLYQNEASGEGIKYMVMSKLRPQREAQMLVLSLHILGQCCTCTLNASLRKRKDWQVFVIPSTLSRLKHKASGLPFCCLATATSLITRVVRVFL